MGTYGVTNGDGGHGILAPDTVTQAIRICLQKGTYALILQCLEPLLPTNAATRAYANINRLNHIFNNPAHKFGPLVSKLGSDIKVHRAIKGALEGLKKTGGLVLDPKTNRFVTSINLNGTIVTIKGAVIDGVIKIGTAFVP